MKFKIEQLALNPKDPGLAFFLMEALGLTEWSGDMASASGKVFGQPASNVASLNFNYDAAPLELEMLNYRSGDNWLAPHNDSVASHIGMHCTEEELMQWRSRLAALKVPVVQEVLTTNHTSKNVPKGRHYKYVIFGTRDIIGIDLKFIVRC